jgi:arylalkylamine N-acetyltransferase
LVKDSDREELLQFLRTFFIRDEPINDSIGLLDGRATCSELEDYSLKELDNGINLKAVSNGKIIGVCLNGILERGYVDEIEEVNCNDKKFAKILKLLDHVAVESKIFSHFPRRRQGDDCQDPVGGQFAERARDRKGPDEQDEVRRKRTSCPRL